MVLDSLLNASTAHSASIGQMTADLLNMIVATHCFSQGDEIEAPTTPKAGAEDRSRGQSSIFDLTSGIAENYSAVPLKKSSSSVVVFFWSIYCIIESIIQTVLRTSPKKI